MTPLGDLFTLVLVLPQRGRGKNEFTEGDGQRVMDWVSGCVCCVCLELHCHRMILHLTIYNQRSLLVLCNIMYVAALTANVRSGRWMRHTVTVCVA